MRRFLIIVALAIASPLGWARQPNIVFILIDDMGWTDLGVMGSDFYETPNIDRLAAEGMLFTNAYANAPNCAPSRAAIMSGQYSPRTGVYTVGSPNRGKKANRRLLTPPNSTTLNGDVVTLAESLRDAGYTTAHIGKWHLGDGDEHGALAQGFDVNVGGGVAGHPKSYFPPYRMRHLDDGPEGEYLTDRLTDEAISFVREAQGRPFFLHLAHYAVHTPIQARPDLAQGWSAREAGEHHRNAKYAAMIESVDSGVGRLMHEIASLGLDDETVVIFTSDNGGHGRITDMSPLRGAKGMLHEGGVRVPLIVRWPGVIEAGVTSETPVIGVDYYPTCLEIAGVQAAPQTLDGVSILPILKGGTVDQRAIYWHFPAYLESGGVAPGPWRTTPASAVRVGRYKLIEFFETERREVYDLVADPGERHDLSESLPVVRDRLAARLHAWQTEVGAPVPREPNPDYRPASGR